MTTIELSFLTAVALAGLGYLLAHMVLTRVPVLRRYHVPAPVLGGLGLAIVLALLWAAGVDVSFPKSGRPVDFLVALLTTNMGLHVTPKVFQEGVRPSFLFIALGAAIFVAQLLLVLPFALASDDPLRTAILLGPLSHVGVPFNLNPPSQLDPIRHLFHPSFPQFQELARGLMMTGILLGAAVAAAVGTRLFQRAGEESPEESPAEKTISESLWTFTVRETALIILILSLISIAFLVQDVLLEALPWLQEGYLPVIVISYLFGALFRLLFGVFAPVGFPSQALAGLLYGPTMGLVLTYALMSIPLHTIRQVTVPMVLASAVAVAASALVAWLAFPLFARLTDRYYAAIISTILLVVTTGFGPVAMAYLRRFGREEGPARPVPVVLPLNAFYLFPWMVSLLTLSLLHTFG